MYRRGEEFMAQMKKRFRWVYLSTGLGILMAAGFSWILETDDTYWIWHRYDHPHQLSSSNILCLTLQGIQGSDRLISDYSAPVNVGFSCSLWHVSIYTSAFVILCSTSSPRWPNHSNRIAVVHTRASVADDPELGGQILRHAVDLDASCLDSEEEDKLLESWNTTDSWVWVKSACS